MKFISTNFPFNLCNLIHIVVFCIIINSISTQNINDNEEKYLTFKQFVSKFHKTYNLKAEYQKREQIYHQNIEHIKRSNCKSCGVNFYADWTEQEMKNLRNVKQSQHKSNIAAIPNTHERLLTQNFPASLDWRNITGISEVKDLGYCGASYAFTTIAFFEQESILSGIANSSINLSEMYLLSCNRESQGCKGGEIESSVDLVIEKGGVPFESKHPFIAERIPPATICLQTELFKIPNVSRMSYYNIKDPEVIKRIVYKKPVISSICGVDLAFYYPRSSNDSSRTLKCNPINKVIDHSVLIVGYTQTQWIVKNSWGKNWGINGYAYISRHPDHDCCIGDQMHTTGQITMICSVIYCKTCVQTYTCSKCQQGRYVSYNTTTGIQTCELCTEPNCAKCYNYMGSCKWCADGYALNATTGKCVVSTIANCNKLDKGLCFQCKPGYKTTLSRGSCSIYCSVNNCNKCPNGPCAECKIGFSLVNTTVNGKDVQYCVLNNCSVGNCSYCDSNGTVCLQCKSGYLLNSTSGTCYTNCTLTDCINCAAGSTTCNECVQGKSYNSTKKACQVFAGTTNCKIHRTTCTTCRTGYTLNTAKQCIQTCISCLTCLQNNQNQCLTCDNSSFLKVETYQTTCVANSCNITNCTACYANGTCMTCATKFLVYNVTSNRCQNQCTLPNCRDCLPNTTVCSYCNPGYAVDYYNKSCVQSNISHCPTVYTYLGELLCWSCDSNYYLDFATYKQCYIYCADYQCQICQQSSLYVCIKCHDGFYPQEQYGGRVCTKIKSIMPGCELISFNQSYCYQCNKYYNFNSTTGSCQLNTQSCPQMCSYCSQTNNSQFLCKCKQQGYTFLFASQTCIPNPLTNNPNCSMVQQFTGVYYCIQCQNNMIVSPDYLNCLPQCSVTNCTQCLDGYSTSCLICDPGFYVDNSAQCSICLPNCRSCTSVKCLACQPGFQLSNNGLNCTRINCSQGFLFDGYSCLCPPGTYYKNSSCHACSRINCAQCSNQQCFSCQEGYFLSQSNCKKCSKNCYSCNSSNTCSQCKDGYILDNTTKLCLNPIQNGASFFISSTVILPCPLSCIECNNQGICKKCLPGYVLFSGQCQACKGTCKTCYPTNTSQCLSCSKGYYLDKTSCVKCNITNCFSCELSASICTKCNEGFYLKDGTCEKCDQENCITCNYAGQCVKCSSGYTLVSDGSCQQCGGNCRSCNSTSINQCFIQCNSTSYLLNNTCIQCPSECKSCISQSVCLSCANGYVLRNTTCSKVCAEGCYECDSSNAQKCYKCISGYYLNSNNLCQINIDCNDNRTCTVCPVKWALTNGVCEMCTVSENCTQCANSNLSQCIKCKPGFFLNNTICVICDESCKTCSQLDRCEVCKDGYFLPINMEQSNCSKCDRMCKTCIDYKDKCTSCNEGYELSVTDKCLRVQKIDAQIELNVALNDFPNVSKIIRNSIVSLVGTQFQNQTKLYIITGLRQGSTILSFTLSIPDFQDPTIIYNKVKTELTTVRQVAGIQLIAVKRIDLIDPNAVQNNETNGGDNNQTLINPVITQTQTSNNNNTNLAIILGIVIPSVVIILGVAGYFLRKKYFKNKVDNESESEFREVADQSIVHGKTNFTPLELGMTPLKEGKQKDIDNFNFTSQNQTYFNSTAFPQQSFQRLDLNQPQLKGQSINQFDNTLKNFVDDNDNQGSQSRRSISNGIINYFQQKNSNEIKGSQASNNPLGKTSQNEENKLAHPEDHNRFFEIQESSKPTSPQNLNQVHNIPSPVNPHLQVVDLGSDEQNS